MSIGQNYWFISQHFDWVGCKFINFIHSLPFCNTIWSTAKLTCIRSVDCLKTVDMIKWKEFISKRYFCLLKCLCQKFIEIVFMLKIKVQRQWFKWNRKYRKFAISSTFKLNQTHDFTLAIHKHSSACWYCIFSQYTLFNGFVTTFFFLDNFEPLLQEKKTARRNKSLVILPYFKNYYCCEHVEGWIRLTHHK